MKVMQTVRAEDGTHRTVLENAQVTRTETDISLVKQVFFRNMRASAVVVHTKAVGGAQTVLAAGFSGQQIDVPRNVIVTNNGAGGFNTGSVVVTGVNHLGTVTSETLVIDPTGGGAVTTGNVAFMFLSQIVFPAVANATVTVDLGTRLGTGISLTQNAQVLAVAKNRNFQSLALYTFDLTYGTVRETGAVINDADEFTLYLSEYI